ncbi:unnamed protein product [Cladocopium goreaui]|uniref:Uncharacterized protein n=1 Tax=Cladocopium goreaui TaxID=2562237 RepID=A0A9P1D009_9DINO|nr:unnamed protein product [Cladocopium goreaui]
MPRKKAREAFSLSMRNKIPGGVAQMLSGVCDPSGVIINNKNIFQFAAYLRSSAFSSFQPTLSCLLVICGAMGDDYTVPLELFCLIPFFLGALCSWCLWWCWSARKSSGCCSDIMTGEEEHVAPEKKKANSKLDRGVRSFSSEFLYLPSSGHCIHSDPGCCNMKSPQKVKVCSKCFV